MDIAALIKNAKIGSERKAAQVETCSPFAAALYDVLAESGLPVSLVVVGHRGATPERSWYHLVVDHNGTQYDSMGEFSQEIIRKRLKIHKSVDFPLSFEVEPRAGCYEDEHEEVFQFLLEKLRNAVKTAI